MSYNTKYASKNSYRYRKNQGYYNHRAYFDDLNQFQLVQLRSMRCCNYETTTRAFSEVVRQTFCIRHKSSDFNRKKSPYTTS